MRNVEFGIVLLCSLFIPPSQFDIPNSQLRIRGFVLFFFFLFPIRRFKISFK